MGMVAVDKTGERERERESGWMETEKRVVACLLRERKRRLCMHVFACLCVCVL